MDALDALRRELPTAGVFVDFDGTLSPIVPRAADARPLPGVGEVLVDLTRLAGRLAVVSGRPVSYLAEHLPDAIELHGLYGLEARIDGEIRERGDAGRWRPVVDEVAAAAVEAIGPSGVDVEHKGLSLTLHFRRVPDAEDEAVGLGPRSGGSVGAAGASRQDVPRAPPAGRPSTRARWSRIAPRASPRSPTSATTWATSPPSTRSTAWPPAGGTS